MLVSRLIEADAEASGLLDLVSRQLPQWRASLGDRKERAGARALRPRLRGVK